MRTPLKQLTDLLLREPVEEWLGRRYAAGRSTREIAADLRTATDNRIVVSHTTIWLWLNESGANDDDEKSA